MLINAAFSIRDRVQIGELSRPGRVTAIHVNETGTTYSVRYFDNGKAHEEYFYEDELKAEPLERVGFSA